MKTILIVDDNAENLYLLELLLKSKGYTVYQAGNGQDALQRAHETKPDLIISDILMPVMDGFSLCREVKSNAMLKDLPFIFYTATYTDEKDEVYALSLGADGFIKKPMEPEPFLGQITQLVSDHEKSPRAGREPLIKDEEESYKLYSERLIQKLEKKMVDLEQEIEQRKTIEDELRIARNEWEETFQAIVSPSLLLDTEFNVIHANRSAACALHKDENELIGKKCHEIFHHADDPMHNCPMAKLIETGAPQSIETEVEALGGVYLLNCAPLTNKMGTIEKIIHIAVDITDRKRTEDKLKESEDRYRRLTDNAKDMIYRMSIPDGEYEFVSPASQELFGYPPETFYASPKLIKSCLHPDWHDYFQAEWRGLLAGRMPPTYEYQIIHKDGSVRWMNQRNSLVRGPGNAPVAIEGIVTDITTRKKMEVELRDSEERFRQLVEHIDEIFWIRDVQSEAILYISPMFESVFGKPVDAMYQNPYVFLDAVVKEDLFIVKNSHKIQMQDKKPTDITYRIMKEKDTRWIRSRAYPIFDESGDLLWIAGIAEDITDVRKAELEHKRLERQLIQSQKIEAIGTLAGGIAHDFNNILSSIIGFTELTLDDVQNESSAHQNLQEVLAAGLRAKELVNQILTLARKSEGQYKPVKVSLIVKEVLKLIRSTVTASIEVRGKIDSMDFVMASPSQLHQVFMNLMTNAAQAMQLKGGVLEVSLSDVMLEENPNDHSVDFEPGPYIKATVSDTGMGISRKHIDNIFNPYFTTKDVGEGTGLGLSITHSIIKGCGGMILLSSEVGQGTTFTVYLPTTARGAEPPPVRTKSLPAGTERILIVDDELAITRVLIQQLKRLGYSVTSRTSSVEALALFKARPKEFDLVVTDMAMPTMTGDILARQLLQIRPTVPIILCTGYSHRMTDERAMQLGIKAFVLKPILMEDLAIKIRKVLEGK